MGSFIRFLPLILVIALGVVLYRGLSLNPQDMPSALVGKTMPAFALKTLKDNGQVVTQVDLLGDIVLVNVWATWCPTCKYEHPYLVDIAKDPQVKLYGLNYKDDRAAAQQWLKNYDDPYVFSIFDEEGTLGLDLGVYGAPETFVIDHHGIIRKRFAGAIDTRVWRREFEPLIAQLVEEKNQGK
ncbi:DsbE family thiol:disulfide interchange protein [Colwellia psychrerythraea]|uniref:Periplasmic protein thiol/disulfide oxidoreductase DsbE n=1 Tax=Colwellia psychrerythraea TaxID=28229 RepID=A0A099KJ67_COLPS|nr:DsbE family thiol:disulfide interchange protein [Colwellia psychrerythraea]KGJ90451.1 periplasmic protein thiol/disulfide oxidoreductase DsbE [Colwellia psychrerythraea]